MIENIETILGCFARIRRTYADNLNLKYNGYHLSPNEISILIILMNNPHIDTASQLSLFQGVSKGLVSRSIDSLISHGLLSCYKDEKDRRISHLFIKDEAHPFLEEMECDIKKMNEKIFNTIPQSELAQAEQVFEKILDCLKQMKEEHS